MLKKESFKLKDTSRIEIKAEKPLTSFKKINGSYLKNLLKIIDFDVSELIK